MVWLNIISSLDISTRFIFFRFRFYTFKIILTMLHLYCDDLWVIVSVNSGEVCRKSAWGPLQTVSNVSLDALKVYESASGVESWHL